MASAFYDKGIERFLKGLIAWNSDDIKIQFLSAAYTPDLAADEFLDDTTGAVGSAVSLASKTTAAGKAGAANTTVTSVTGAEIVYILIYKDTGDPATSPLIALIDDATGLPYTPVGSDIVVVWDPTNGIFLL